MRQALLDLGAIGPALFVAAVALRPFLLLPSWVLLVTGGILFGTFWGTVWSSLGTVAGGLWVYGVARGLAREAIERRMSGAVRRVDAYLADRGALWLAVYTLMPATPMTPAFAAAGLSSIGPLTFLLATVVGAVPRCALYTFFAAALLSGDRGLITVSSLLLGAALLVGWLVRRRWLGPAARADGA